MTGKTLSSPSSVSQDQRCRGGEYSAVSRYSSSEGIIVSFIYSTKGQRKVQVNHNLSLISVDSAILSMSDVNVVSKMLLLLIEMTDKTTKNKNPSCNKGYKSYTVAPVWMQAHPNSIQRQHVFGRPHMWVLRRQRSHLLMKTVRNGQKTPEKGS